MEKHDRHERTEAGNRPGIDDDEHFRGIARHPLARRWLKQVYTEARSRGNVSLASKTRALMKKLGMEVRA